MGRPRLCVLTWVARAQSVLLPPAPDKVVKLGNGITESDLLVHDETDEVLAFLLSAMQPPKFPTPIGVFRAVHRQIYDRAASEQIAQAKEQKGPGDLDDLFGRGDTWEVPG